jgi:aminopeptidase N
VNSYGRPEEEHGIELALNSAVAALNYFSDMFGPYPYTELDIIATPVEAMGMEYPGAIAISRLYYDLTQNFSGIPARAMLEGIVLHEVAHQWFYNMVGSNQPQESWLDEALIQYLMALFYRDSYGYGAYMGFRESWLTRWDRVERQTIPIGMPGEKYQKDEIGAILYGRGPLFMEQLAEKFGLENFRGFLRQYYEQHAWKIATGESFKALAEKQCACDLTPLFEEWVYY